MAEGLIKSKKRVQQHGEVFTPSWMVDLMLDIPGIKEATESIDATFLEPAAGDGNFLVAILNRKLDVVERLFRGDTERCKQESLWALASIYGIEYLEDNLCRAQERMMDSYCVWWLNIIGENLDRKNDYYRSAQFIVSRNIVRGDTLEQKHPLTQHPITFFVWERMQSPNIVSYHQEKLGNEVQPVDSNGIFYNPDTGHQQAVPETLFSIDFTIGQEMLSGTIELSKVYKMEEQ